MDNKDIASSLGYKLVDQEETKQENQEEVKETPTVEESKESTESSLQKETDETSTEETTEEVVSPDFNSMLSEKFDGKFKSFEELKEALDNKPEPKDDKKYEDERLNTLVDFMEKGGQMEDFLSTQLTNYDEMSDEALIKAELKSIDKDLTDEDIALLFSDRYKLDEEEFEEDQIKLSKLKLRRDAKEAKRKLVEEQKKYLVTEKKAEPKQEIVEEKPQETTTGISQEEIARRNKEWSDVVEKATSESKPITFALNDNGESFDYTLTDDVISKVKTDMSDLSTFWARYVKEDGTNDVEKLKKDFVILNNYENILKAAYSQFRSQGREDVLKDIKNPSFEASSKTNTNDKKSLAAQIYNAWKKNN